MTSLNVCPPPLQHCQGKTKKKHVVMSVFISQKTALLFQCFATVSLHHAVIIVILFHAGKWKRHISGSGGNWQVGFAKQPQAGVEQKQYFNAP